MRKLPNEVVIEVDGKQAPNPRISRYNAETYDYVPREEITARLHQTAKKAMKQLNDDLAVSTDTLSDYMALSAIDVERQAVEMPENISDKLVHDGNPRSLGTNVGATSKTVSIREFLDPVGYFEEMTGDNDEAPYMERDFSTDTMTLQIRGLAHKESLGIILADTLYNPVNVNRAFARALVVERNREVIEPIINATYTGNTVDAVTGGATFFDNMRATLFKMAAKVTENKITIGKVEYTIGELPGRFMVLVTPGMAQLLNMKYNKTDDLPISQQFANVEFIPVPTTVLAKYGAKPAPIISLPPNTGYAIYLPDYQAAHMRVTPVEDLVKTGTGTARSGGSAEVAHFRYSGIYNKLFLPNGAGKGCIVKGTFPDPTT